MPRGRNGLANQGNDGIWISHIDIHAICSLKNSSHLIKFCSVNIHFTKIDLQISDRIEI